MALFLLHQKFRYDLRLLSLFHDLFCFSVLEVGPVCCRVERSLFLKRSGTLHMHEMKSSITPHLPNAHYQHATPQSSRTHFREASTSSDLPLAHIHEGNIPRPPVDTMAPHLRRRLNIASQRIASTAYDVPRQQKLRQCSNICRPGTVSRNLTDQRFLHIRVIRMTNDDDDDMSESSDE